MKLGEGETGAEAGGLKKAMLAVAVFAVFAAPLAFAEVTVDIGAVKYLIITVAAVALFALFAQSFVSGGGDRISFAWAVPDLFAVAFLLFSLATVPASLNRYESILAWGNLASCFVFYVYVSRAGRGAADALFRALAASGAVAAAYTLVAATVVWRTRIDMSGDIVYQMKNWLIAPMGGNNFTAALLALGIPAAGGAAIGRGVRRGAPWAAAGLLQALALAACLSRTAIAVAAIYGVCLVVFLLVSGKRRAAGICAGAAAAVVLLAGVLFYIWAGGHAGRLTGDLAMTRGMKSSQGATSYRMRLHWWKDAYRMGSDNIAGGVGYGGFEFVHPRYRSIGEEFIRPETRLSTPHNDYLHAFAESGALGVVLYAAMLFSGLWFAAAGAMKTKGGSAAAVASVGVLGVAALYGFADFPFQMPACRLAIFVALGAACGAALESGGRKVELTVSPALRAGAIALLAMFVIMGLKQCTAFAAQMHVYEEIRLQDSPGKAIEEFMKAVRLDGRARYSYTYAGSAYFNASALEKDPGKGRKLLAESINMFERALKEDPYDYNAINFMGVAMYRAGRVREAAVQFNRAAEIYPLFANPHRNLGVMWQESGDMEKAKAEFAKALELNPAQPDVLFELALMMQNELRYRAALDLLTGAVKLDPKNREYRKEFEKVRAVVEANMAPRGGKVKDN